MNEIEQDLPGSSSLPSDEENDINFINKRKNRNRKIMDSDSDSEITPTIHSNTVVKPMNEVDETQDSGSENLQNRGLKKHRRIAVVDSDSESLDTGTSELAEESSRVPNENIATSDPSENVLVENNPNVPKQPKRIVNIEGDSDDDNLLPTPHNKSFPDVSNLVEEHSPIYIIDSSGKLLLENSHGAKTQKSRLAALCDTESSDEDSNYSNYNDESNVDHATNQNIKKKVSKKTRAAKENGPKKMTGKEAAEQRREIQSESQRMLRESRVSLPYHKPRSYTLKEFMQKRSKFASILPTKGEERPSVGIKMSRDQLEAVSKKLNERIKEVEEFYKSESEPEVENKSSAENNEDIAIEIRSWLDILVNSAVDQSQIQLVEPIVDNIELKENSDLEVPQSDQVQTSEYLDLNNADTQDQLMEYEFNLDDINEVDTDIPEPPNKLDLLRERVANICPKLSGGPDDVIDLEEGVTSTNAVKQLFERFVHNTAKKPLSHKHKVQLNVVSVNSGKICEETVAMNVDDEEDLIDVETPGVKRQKLISELQSQMAQNRSELWRQKQARPICPVQTVSEDRKSDYEDDLLDDEEEGEMTESSADEELEDDLREKPRVKSAFVDDEAEEDDQDELRSDKGFDGDDDSVDGENLQNDMNDDCSEKSFYCQPKKKVLKRIVSAFREDSDDEDEVIGKTGSSKEVMKEMTSSETMDNNYPEIDASGDDYLVLPPNLPRVQESPRRMDDNKSELDFLTPVTYLTGIQCLNSGSRFSRESPVISLSLTRVGSSPVKDNWQSKLQKKLFEDQTNSPLSQCNIAELSDECSGELPETQETLNDVTTQDLINVCSGTFPETSQLPIDSTEVNSSSNEVLKVTDENKDLAEEQDQIIISQLIDEDELEQFKKQFESPMVNNVASRSKDDESVEEVNATGFLNSDDENDELEVKQRKWKKKLVFSDDSSEEDDEVNQDGEEINLHDTDGESLDQPADNIRYDSEENEIVLNEKPGGLKVNDFFENEAELSESEWESEDEDEKGLDQLEAEQGDAENYDEAQVRNDLEKIHMRRMLDDDTREVKLLQELLLEDGELHGAGRQRQFKWKNIGAMGNDGDTKADEEDTYLDEEEESEEQFRKMRHQREMFLKKKSQSDDVGSIFNDSQVLKISQKVITKSLSLTPQTPPIQESDNIVTKQPFSLVNKRGSFLARNDEVLERLAEYTKVSTNVVGSTKTKGRNFVFQTTTKIETTTIERDNKRKAPEVNSNPQKKLKLTISDRRKGQEKSSGSNTMFADW